MKFLFAVTYCMILCICNLKGFAQITDSTTARVSYIKKIGLFAPIYLDSVFGKNKNYLYKGEFPRFSLQGFEFSTGCSMALMDSISTDTTTQLTIVDTKSLFFKKYFDNTDSLQMLNQLSDSTKSVDQSFAEDFIKLQNQIDGLQVIICMEKDLEYLKIARFAQKKNIILLSVNYPNNGGVKYPYSYIFSPTLKTHCEFIMENVLEKSGSNIIVISKKDKQDLRTISYFKNYKPTIQKNIKYITVDSNFNPSYYFDSTKINIVINASFNEALAFNVSDSLYAMSEKNYKITFWGMPNWDGFRVISKKKQKMFPFQYSSYYFLNKNDSVHIQLRNAYTNKYKGTPGDNFFRGYNTMQLAKTIQSSDPAEKIATDINDHPQFGSQYRFIKTSFSTDPNNEDAYENKHLYILKKTGETVKKLQ